MTLFTNGSRTGAASEGAGATGTRAGVTDGVARGSEGGAVLAAVAGVAPLEGVAGALCTESRRTVGAPAASARATSA